MLACALRLLKVPINERAFHDMRAYLHMTTVDKPACATTSRSLLPFNNALSANNETIATSPAFAAARHGNMAL